MKSIPKKKIGNLIVFSLFAVLVTASVDFHEAKSKGCQTWLKATQLQAWSVPNFSTTVDHRILCVYIGMGL